MHRITEVLRAFFAHVHRMVSVVPSAGSSFDPWG